MRRPTVTQLVDFDKCEKLGVLKVNRKESINTKRQDAINRGVEEHSKMEASRLVDGRCFVATFAFNDSEAVEVIYLRAFRDNVLLQCGLGKYLVAKYYKWSPSLVEFLSAVPAGRWLAKLSVIALIKVIRLVRGSGG